MGAGDAKHGRLALWRLGFRPFYLAGSFFAALSIALWGAQYTGLLGFAYLNGPVWHAHEMLFGFTMAVLAGFLLTAVRAWTKLPTPSGPSLVLLVGLWLAGRISVLLPYPVAAAVINTCFPLCLAILLGRVLARGDRRHNLIFSVLLLLLALSQLAVHLGQMAVFPLSPWFGIQCGLDIMLFVMTVLGGRVIPMFTRSGIPGAKVDTNTLVERIIPVSVGAVLLGDLLHAEELVLAAIVAFAALVQIVRWSLWRPWQALRVPLVWVLHLGYLWIPIHLALRALAQLSLLPATLAAHALTTGAIGALTLGMMTRTARGHTGRPLVADGFDTTCYALVILSALVRVGMPVLMPEKTLAAIVVSACLWSAAFAVIALRYLPVLTRPRIDGAAG